INILKLIFSSTGAHTQTLSANITRKCLKAAAVTLGVLYLLTLSGVFIRYILSSLEKDQLQRTYENLHNNHSQLQNELKKLQEKIAGMCCPEGWKRFGCSCYYKSTERKKWDESRTECLNREADLVVINSKEEQVSFLSTHD
uniref:C-type lectin domain-containing protein n=1 Tax=Oreochromis niloticus TaxID=8128 RepID=A0A669DM47_ORENI